jgi:4-amino-4-deoxy-L-arabinose transferase-like glycosyltransferase
MKYFQMKFLTKKVFSPGMIVLIHVAFSIVLIMTWTIIKRGWDFSVTTFPNENFYMYGGQGVFNAAAVLIGAMFKYLHFNHLTFYLFNVFLSATTVIVFFHLASTCLDRKLALYVTAIFAFNPELAFYNNFVLKENLLILILVVAMYCFFKALETNNFAYKILFFLLLPLITLIREPLVLLGLLPLAFFRKPMRRLIILSGAMVACGLLYLMREKTSTLILTYWSSHIGNYGATKEIFKNIFGVSTEVTFGELFSSPTLFAEYFFRSLLYYIRPGWNAGVKLNSFLIPYSLFTVFVFIASLSYRKCLSSTYRTAYLLITSTIILISLVLIIYDPIERYRYSVYQLGFSLLVLNLRGYQKCIHGYSCPKTAQIHTMIEHLTA